MIRHCSVCGSPLPPGRKLYCSRECGLEARRRKRRERKEKGLCPECGMPSGGKSLCPECLAARERSTAVRWVRLRDEGLCRNCGKPAGLGHVYCAECRTKVSRDTKALRARRREEGLCERCGTRPVCKAGHCEECYHAQLKKGLRRRDHLRGEGRCIVCMQPIEPRPDGSLSPYCHDHERQCYGSFRKRYWERRADGLCTACGELVERDENGLPLYARCPKCRERAQETKLRRKMGMLWLRKRLL